MDALREAILNNRRRNAPNAEGLDVAALMENILRQLVQEKLPQLAQKLEDIVAAALTVESPIRTQLQQHIMEAMEQGVFDHLRGEKGDTPEVSLAGLARYVDIEALAKLVPQLDEEQVATRAASKVKVLTVEEVKAIARSVIPADFDDEDELDEPADEDLEEIEETPEELVDKILSSKKKLNLGSIEGLEPMLKSIQRALRERTKGGAAGGGMGNTQHERFVVTSATTSVQLAHRIAADGFAIMSASYNDGTLMRGKDYTVGTDHRTITLVFTPDDPLPGQNNLVHFVYVRT